MLPKVIPIILHKYDATKDKETHQPATFSKPTDLFKTIQSDKSIFAFSFDTSKTIKFIYSTPKIKGSKSQDFEIKFDDVDFSDLGIDPTTFKPSYYFCFPIGHFSKDFLDWAVRKATEEKRAAKARLTKKARKSKRARKANNAKKTTETNESKIFADLESEMWINRYGRMCQVIPDKFKSLAVGGHPDILKDNPVNPSDWTELKHNSGYAYKNRIAIINESFYGYTITKESNIDNCIQDLRIACVNYVKCRFLTACRDPFFRAKFGLAI
ncbi:MAG: hypothetical protein FWF97_00590 [Alphaproteobacteria bacterium]|nr:hypothetical protein [Alphaproteobacteria bacterium]